MRRVRLCLLLVLVGVLARGVAPIGRAPHGDVLLDVGVARSLARGEGFAAGFERGTALVRGAGPVVPQDLADQHPPLWPLAGAALSPLAGGAFGGLRLASVLAGLALLVLVWRVTDRLVESESGAPDGLAPLACAVAATSFLLVEYAGNGSLYTAQAAGVLLLVELLARPRPSAPALGLLCGALLLLNYQNAVLLAVPPVVLLLGSAPARRAAPGELTRREGARTAVAAVLFALLCQVPWWWRNAVVFGDPLHSVNGLYFLHHAGIEPVLAVEDGRAVLRFLEPLGVAHVAGALATHVPRNLLYLLSTGLFVWPGLIGIVAAGAFPALLGAWRRRERRTLALVASLGALAAIAVVWPACKLRYLVPLTPLVVALGVRLAAGRPLRGERLGAALVVAAWLGLLVATRGDVLLTESDPRPARWHALAWGGALLMVAPLLLRYASRVGAAARVVLVSGVLVNPVLLVLVAVSPPGTAYHSTPFTPDFFGQHAELAEARRAAQLDELARLARAGGARLVAGPLGLLAADAPALVELPRGLGTAAGAEGLAALLERLPVDHVVTPRAALERELGREQPGARPDPGTRWLYGRLVVVAVHEPASLQDDAGDTAASGGGPASPAEPAAADGEDGAGGMVLSRVVR